MPLLFFCQESIFTLQCLILYKQAISLQITQNFPLCLLLWGRTKLHLSSCLSAAAWRTLKLLNRHYEERKCLSTTINCQLLNIPDGCCIQCRKEEFMPFCFHLYFLLENNKFFLELIFRKHRSTQLYRGCRQSSVEVKQNNRKRWKKLETPPGFCSPFKTHTILRILSACSCDIQQCSCPGCFSKAQIFRGLLAQHIKVASEQ